MGSVGRNIRRLRIAAGYKTQGAFAGAIGVPQPRLSDWENDRYGLPEVQNLLRIAKVLQVSLDDLLAGVDADYDRLRESDLPGQPSASDSIEEGIANARAVEDLMSRYDHLRSGVQQVADTLYQVLNAPAPEPRAVSAPRRRSSATNHSRSKRKPA